MLAKLIRRMPSNPLSIGNIRTSVNVGFAGQVGDLDGKSVV
jgi:hypothetical protein